MRTLLTFILALILFSCTNKTTTKQFEGENLVFDQLATSWDEAMPLGNGMVGNLLWQKKRET